MDAHDLSSIVERNAILNSVALRQRRDGQNVVVLYLVGDTSVGNAPEQSNSPYTKETSDWTTDRYSPAACSALTAEPITRVSGCSSTISSEYPCSGLIFTICCM